MKFPVALTLTIVCTILGPKCLYSSKLVGTYATALTRTCRAYDTPYSGKIDVKELSKDYYWISISTEEDDEMDRRCNLEGSVTITGSVAVITEKTFRHPESNAELRQFEIYLDFSKAGKIYLQPKFVNTESDEELSLCARAGVYEIVDNDNQEPKKRATLKRGTKDPVGGSSSIHEMAQVPAGSFYMGDLEHNSFLYPAHEVYLDAFLIDTKEVSFSNYLEFCRITHRNRPSDNGWNDPRLPVTNVTYTDACEYCAWKKKRLPTDAEWEKAARGGTSTNYFFGDSIPSDVDKYAWYAFNSGGRPHPSGEKLPNQFGLYDMCGNVAEWCLDSFSILEKQKAIFQRNPLVKPEDDVARVVRGGAWCSSQDLLKSWTRMDEYIRNQANCSLGFRCARALTNSK